MTLEDMFKELYRMTCHQPLTLPVAVVADLVLSEIYGRQILEELGIDDGDECVA